MSDTGYDEWRRGYGASIPNTFRQPEGFDLETWRMQRQTDAKVAAAAAYDETIYWFWIAAANMGLHPHVVESARQIIQTDEDFRGDRDDPSHADKLARLFNEHTGHVIAAFRRAVNAPMKDEIDQRRFTPETEFVTTDDGRTVLAADFAFGKLLSKIGTNGNALAERWLKAGAIRVDDSQRPASQVSLPLFGEPLDAVCHGLAWWGWTGGHGKKQWPHFLMVALWLDTAKPKIERKREASERLLAPSMAFAVVTNFSLPIRERAKPVKTDGALALFGAKGGHIGAFPGFPALSPAARNMVYEGAKHMRSVLVDKLIRHLTRRAWEQALHDVKPFTRLVYQGGFKGLAEELGVRGRRRTELRHLVEALQEYRGNRRDIPPAIAYHETKAAPGRSAELVIHVLDALAPGYVHVLKQNGRRAPDTWLLPIPPDVTVPVGVRANDLARVADLQWEVLRVFRGKLDDLDDGWNLAEAAELAAEKAKTPTKIRDRAVEHWQSGGDDWLAKLPSGRVTLADDRALKLFRDARDRAKRKSTSAKRRHFARKSKGRN